MRDELGDIAHRTDWHQRDYLLHGCQDIIFTRVSPDETFGSKPGLYVDIEPDRIMCSAELIESVADNPAFGATVKDNVLRVVAVNADMSYELERLACGCWLGRRLV